MELGNAIGALATLLATLGAFKISRDWRNQKGSEVLSKKCENVLNNLDPFLESLLYTILLYIKTTIDTENYKSYCENNYKTNNLYSEIIKELETVCKYKKTKDLKETKEYIIDIYKTYELISQKIRTGQILDINDFKNCNIDSSDLIKEFSIVSNKIEKYKKTIDENLIKYIFHKK